MVVTGIVSKAWKRMKLKINNTLIPAKKHTVFNTFSEFLYGVRVKNNKDGDNDRKKKMGN